MKIIPPPCPEPEIGPKYFRSVDELADTPEFRGWAEKEFPAGASELTDESTRRDFMKLMSASFLLAGFGLTGCRRPEEHIYPFAQQPEGYVHGVPQYFATALPTRTGAVPLLVKSSDGRPTKVEVNPLHPDPSGTDSATQASVLGLYDPDRAQLFRSQGNTVKREVALDALGLVSRKFSANGGAGLTLLAEPGSSPSRARLQAALKQKFPLSKWAEYDALDTGAHARAASAVTGRSVQPYFRIDKARRILSLDCDFLGTEEDSTRYIRDFSRGRKITKADASRKDDLISRLYAVESLMTSTGANADHRLRIAPSRVLQVAARLAVEVISKAGFAGAGAVSSDLARLAQGFNGDARWINECALDLVAHRGGALVLAGQRQPLAVHVIAQAMNAVLGSLGTTVELHEAPGRGATDIASVVADLTAGSVDTLVILGANPAFNAPADLNWPAAQGRAKSVIRLGYHEDETFAGCAWHLPAAHYLESWGDARTSDGTLVPVQPLIAPLFGGLTELEVLARLIGSGPTNPHEIVRETFATIAGASPGEEKWKQFLHDGFLADSRARPVSANFHWSAAAGIVATAKSGPAPSKGNLEVIFHRGLMEDGRLTNNGWLQELPDPITKLVWDNAVLLSRKTASELGVKNTEVVEIVLAGRKITGPVWVQPGMADDTLGLALGYGRDRGGRIANFNGGKVGFNVHPLRTSSAMHLADGATARGTGRLHKFSCTQDHWALHGRPIVREANLDQFFKKPDFAKNMDLDAHMGFILERNPDGTPKNIYKHPYDSHPQLKSTMHQWGMAVDLNSCVGCSACVIACQSENNIPIVGKDQVGRGREMHWMRIDRYYSGDPTKLALHKLTDNDEEQATKEWIDDPQVVNQPMMCQHCESAPCESVCPVNATVHDEEGLNIMAYNRCVGTRYCANNCAWKVRRFNFFDYNKRPLNGLYNKPFDPAALLTGKFFNERPADELDLVAMARNPDVTVRMRGVMEKCTFCVQRIEQAKIAQKVKAGASGDVEVKDGTIRTACQEACPAEAIEFGNILDPESRVSRLKQQERDYAVLGFLDNRPRTTYLAKIRNPNPAMPDHRVWSLEAYTIKHGDPLIEHGAPGGKKGTH